MKVKAFLLSLLLSNTIGIQAQTSKVNVTFDGWSGDATGITRLYDSLDPGKKIVGDMNGDGVVNVADIVELINGGGEVNPEEIKAIVNTIMAK